MIRSMTGYGRGSSSGQGYGVAVELRSVNHRYLDLALRLPREFYSLEEKLRQLLQAKIRRGRVEAHVSLLERPAEICQVRVNYELAGAYHRALQDLSTRLELPGEISLDNLTRLPDIFILQESVLPEDLVWPVLEEAAGEALKRLLKQREDEGENLRKDLLGHCSQAQDLWRAISRRAPEARREAEERIGNKLNGFLGDHYEENRLLMECSILVERMGIDEELVRLESHLEAFINVLSGEGPAGRKLDFIVQELLREVNTIGSKAGDYTLSSLVVEMKAVLEKLREQIQNLE